MVIAIGLFLLITVLISTIIVFFLSRIHKLEAILDQAIVIDNNKEERLSEFYEAFQAERTKTSELEKELEYLSKGKVKLVELEKKVERLTERLVQEEREHFNALHTEKSALKQLSVHYELLEQTYVKQEETLSLLQKRNEMLVDDNNRLHLEIRESHLRLMEQQKQN